MTPEATDPTAGEGLSEAIGMSLYESLMESSADQWRRWEFLTDAAKETYRAEAARIVATAVAPLLAARESAAATRARAEGKVAALEELRRFIGMSGYRFGDRSDHAEALLMVDEAARIARADSLAPDAAGESA